MGRILRYWLLVSLLCLPLVIVGCSDDDDDDKPLLAWTGRWVNTYTFLDNSAMKPVYDAVAETAGSGYTSEQAKIFIVAMLQSTFGGLNISGETITYYESDGVTTRATCTYRSEGEETATFEGSSLEWNKFSLKAGDSGCNEYRYLITTQVHSHGDGLTHWHFRYGTNGFDDLINNSDYAMWWPTAALKENTAQDLADDYLSEVEELAEMIKMVN